jgi:hypothetical protein
MRAMRWTATAAALLGAFVLGWTLSGRAVHGGDKDTQPDVKGWTKGKGWGPWGKDDEVGSLNAMTPATRKAALSLVKEGKVYDLGDPDVPRAGGRPPAGRLQAGGRPGLEPAPGRLAQLRPVPER